MHRADWLLNTKVLSHSSASGSRPRQERCHSGSSKHLDTKQTAQLTAQEHLISASHSVHQATVRYYLFGAAHRTNATVLAVAGPQLFAAGRLVADFVIGRKGKLRRRDLSGPIVLDVAGRLVEHHFVKRLGSFDGRAAEHGSLSVRIGLQTDLREVGRRFVILVWVQRSNG